MRGFVLSILIVFSILGYSQVPVNFVADTAYGCNELTVQFTDITPANNIISRLWEFGDGQISTDSTVSYTYNTVGTFLPKLTITTTADTSSKLKTIIVRKKPNISVEISKFPNYTISDTLYFSYKEILFKSSSVIDTFNYTYNWVFNTDIILDTTSTISNTFTEVGEQNYKLIVSAFAGCSDSVSAKIDIKDEVFTPNIFTPNGDGKNDIFYAQTDGATTYKLAIFSRYGTIVYVTTATKILWDGRTSAGEELETGTYFYVLEDVNSDYYKKGTVYLGR